MAKRIIKKKRHLLTREGFDGDDVNETNISLADMQSKLLELSSLAAEIEMKDNITAAKKHYTVAMELERMAETYKKRSREISAYITVNKPTGHYRGNAEALKKYRENKKK